MYAGISLRITDKQGVPIKQATVGVPFNIEAVASATMRDFEMDGLDAVTILGKQTKSQYINGVTTVTYVFPARIDKVGSYTIGPVTAEVDGTIEASNAVNLTVATEQDAPKKVQQAFLRLSVDKKNVVVGERIAGTLRFYYCHDEVSVEQIAKSDLSPFTVGEFSEAKRGRETIDDIEYTYAEITWHMAPKHAGTITIPAWSANYSVPLSDDTFGPFRLLHGLQRQQKRVYSNALSLQVAPLPAHDGPVHAVGSFDDVMMQASSQVAKEGEANVIRFDVIGDGTFEGYEPIQLVGLSDALKSYESKQYTKKRSDGATQHSYEFIVQGLKAGDWEVPAQEFTYFDVARKQYVTHKTMPLLLSVIAQPGLKTAVVVDEPTGNVPDVDNEPSMLPLNSHGVWYPQNHRELPFNWFLALLVVPFSLIGFQQVRRWYAWYRRRREPAYRKKYAHIRAYNALCDIEKRKAYHEMYPIFIELFATRTDIALPECSDDTIVTLLREGGLSHDDIIAWQRFFADIAGLAYAGAYQKVSSDDVVKRAHTWLKRLKEVV